MKLSLSQIHVKSGAFTLSLYVRLISLIQEKGKYVIKFRCESQHQMKSLYRNFVAIGMYVESYSNVDMSIFIPIELVDEISIKTK